MNSFFDIFVRKKSKDASSGKGKVISKKTPASIADDLQNNMSIIAYICDSVKKYKANGISIVNEMVAAGQFRCSLCIKPLYIQSYYTRGIKETGESIDIAVLRCRSKCMKGDALLPDFIAPQKHYGAREIEKVMIESQTKRVSDVETKASESTVYRWIAQVGASITAAISVVKAIYVSLGTAVSELALDVRGGFAELESLLDMAPKRINHSGITLGLANIWLGARSPPSHI